MTLECSRLIKIVDRAPMLLQIENYDSKFQDVSKPDSRLLTLHFVCQKISSTEISLDVY